MKRILFVLVVLCLLLTGCVSKSTYETLQKENEDLKAKVEEQQLFLDAADKLLNDFHKEIKLYKETFGEVYEDVQPPYKGAKSMNIKNNPDAVNPSWEQLVAFLKQDTTEKIQYWDSPLPETQAITARQNTIGLLEVPKLESPVTFVCCEFANLLHDNAEASGIRAAVVAIHAKGEDYAHLLNAFETTDMGLVYIDCTGAKDCNGFDKVCYIKKGEEAFGFELQDDNPWDYERFIAQKQLWDEYREIIEYYKIGFAQTSYYKKSHKIIGLEASVWSDIQYPYVLPPGDYQFSRDTFDKVKLMHDKVKKLGIKQLTPIFELKGTVTEVEIYW